MLDLGIENLVTYNPLAVSVKATLDDAMNSMDEYHFRHLPVVDEQRRLVGIVSDLDIRRATDTKFANVGDVMTSSPVAVSQHAPPTDALRIMLDLRCHSVPVVDGEKLIGIITSTDFLREFSYGEANSGDTISGHMLGDEYHVRADAPIAEALAAMRELNCDYLAVLKGACPVGVVSRRTLAVWTEFSQASEPSRVKVMQLAATNVPTVLPSDSLQTAARSMLDHGTTAAIVADRANQLAGLLTDGEILSVLIDRMEFV